ncbi:Uma2 family endonuclease [Candidatus Electrothrix sp.]|uniref:Uma2 family endonuclease n=1 Tax=Candidatus Electrothrix sp. TaxID=2170559 RepID=UPI004056ECD7
MQLTERELPQYTYEDYTNWEGRWELIQGIPYAMSPSPSYTHQRISQKIARLLDEALDDCASCQAVLPVDWKISDDTVVQPDNMVLCYQPQGSFLIKAPSLIFEILSPSTSSKDRITKFNLYEEEGVDYYCIVDPKTGTAKVYVLRDGRYVKLLDATDETVTFTLKGCVVDFDFSRIWE